MGWEEARPPRTVLTKVQPGRDKLQMRQHWETMSVVPRSCLRHECPKPFAQQITLRCLVRVSKSGCHQTVHTQGFLPTAGTAASETPVIMAAFGIIPKTATVSQASWAPGNLL